LIFGMQLQGLVIVNHPFTNIGFDGLDHFYISDTTLCDKVCQWLATGQHVYYNQHNNFVIGKSFFKSGH
jgi:hypothetical protein